MKAFARRAGREPRVTPRGTLEAPAGYDVLVSVGVSITGPVAVWSSATGEAELTARQGLGPDQPSFPVTRAVGRSRVALAAYGDSTSPTAVTVVDGLPIAHPHIDVLADGAFLVVGARCAWHPEGPELNALVIDRTGGVVRRGCLGDGIQHLQVADDDTIWVGYFDEGIYGNFGWGGPGPTPLGAGGIAAWSPALAKVWELDPQEGLVSDCYAFNVSGEEVLACPYTDFPVVRIRDRHPRVFPTRDVSGPSGILAAGDQVALLGTYRDPSLIVLGTVDGGAFHETRRTHLWAADGSALPMSRIACRGPVAHFFTGSTWSTFDLRDA